MLAINPKIKQKAEDIRKKIFGSEVRESLASGIEAISEDVEATIGRQDYVEEQFQNVIDETTDKDVISAPELIAARNGKSNLKTRLDDEHAQVTAQLQQKAEQDDMLRVLNQTDPNKNYKFISCVLRNSGSGWYIINDSGHKAMNVLSVEQDSLQIKLNYGFTAKSIATFVATPDESIARDGVFLGASVGLEQAKIQMAQIRNVDGYVYYDGTNWVFESLTTNDPLDYSFSFSGGILTITHPTASRDNLSLLGKGGSPINYQIGNISSTTTQVIFTDLAGALITTPATNMKFHFSRGSLLRIGPSDYVSASGNIWCFGIMEVE